jgi:hypothetical protein
VFDSWDAGASVRASERPLVQSEGGERRLFPEAMVPVLAASTVADEWPAHIRLAITTQHLYRYLNFTVHLESSLVNPTLLSIFNGYVGVSLNDRNRLDTLRMYCRQLLKTDPRRGI